MRKTENSDRDRTKFSRKYRQMTEKVVVGKNGEKVHTSSKNREKVQTSNFSPFLCSYEHFNLLTFEYLESD